MKPGMIVAMLAALAWGFVYAATEKIVERMNPVSAIVSFYAAGVFLTLPLLVLNRADIVQGISADPKTFFATTVAIMGAEFLIVWSISLLGGTEAALVEVSYPLWTALFLFLLYGQKPSWEVFVGGVLIMAGISMLALNGRSEVG